MTAHDSGVCDRLLGLPNSGERPQASIGGGGPARCCRRPQAAPTARRPSISVSDEGVSKMREKRRRSQKLSSNIIHSKATTNEIMKQTFFNSSASSSIKVFLPSSSRISNKFLSRGTLILSVILVVAVLLVQCNKAAEAEQKQPTQPSLDRQVGAPQSSSSMSLASSSSSSPSLSSTSATSANSQTAVTKQKPAKQTASQQKKAAALAAQQNYDRHQLKASPSHSAGLAAAAAAASPSAEQKKAEAEKQDTSAASSSSSASDMLAQKKAGGASKPLDRKNSSFSLLKKFLPSFMSSAAAAAAVSAATSAGSSSSDNYNINNKQHQRSSATNLASSGQEALGGGGLPGKVLNYITGASKKRMAIPDHAPVFMRQKIASERQGGPAALASVASSLLSNPLGLGLLFSAPLLPSLLLTPLAIAGLSPAMSAINNFFGDDEEEQANNSKPSGPLSALMSNFGGQQSGNSPLASILQATGNSIASPSSSSSSADSSSSSSSPSNNFALQAFQSLVLGPTSTTERPLFNPGMFASPSSGPGIIQQAAANLANNQNQPMRASGLLGSSSGGGAGAGAGAGGGGLLQAAASMLSPSFAAPPSSVSTSSSATDSDSDGLGLVQMASDVFEKVASYVGSTQTGVESNKDGISQASGQPGQSTPVNSPLSALASLSSLSPFQLSSLFASTPLGHAASSPSAGHSGGGGGSHSHSHGQKVGFFSTLRNVYELFTSSFLRRQATADGSDSNECQQRLICELHQRAMNSKLFRRSLQSNLMELAQLDKNLLEQIKYSAGAFIQQQHQQQQPQIQARVDADTKAMLNDFLKATNNFKQGRELVNCGQMFPRCSRVQLLAAANAHLTDPVNGRAIGKFSQLMKKMKFKSNQQHQSQWKLRKPGSKLAAPLGSMPQQAGRAVVQAPIDYLQVAPLSPKQASVPQLTPADSLKLVQQIMLMSQQQQQQQQQQQVPAAAPMAAQASTNYNSIVPSPGQFSQANYASGSQYSPAPQQYSPAPAPKQTTYTDAIGPYSPIATESPYYLPTQQQQQYTNSPMFVQSQDFIPQQSARQQTQAQNYYAPSYGSSLVDQQQQPMQQQQQQPIQQQQQQQSQQSPQQQQSQLQSPQQTQQVSQQQNRQQQVGGQKQTSIGAIAAAAA